MKNPLTPAGIEPATFVAQRLNQCATAVPEAWAKKPQIITPSTVQNYARTPAGI